VHDELSVGEEIALSGPYGQFFVRKSDQKMSFSLQVVQVFQALNR
jgi:ferredoxin-NADP reductase